MDTILAIGEKNPSHVSIQHILYMGSKLSLVSQETLAE